MGHRLKYIAIAAIVIVLGMVGFNALFPSGGDPEITGIQAEFVGEIGPGGKYTRSMFEVKGITPAGRTVELNDFSVSDPSAEEVEEGEEKPPLRAAEHGDSCEVIVEAQGYTDTVTVAVTREAKSSTEIGFPEKSSVTVTYYDNGDLEFTGKGNVMNFAGDMPWADCDYTHVYIDEALEVEMMDSWFEDNDKLVYCDPLPKTVKTLKHTFSGCESLEKTPEYFQCSDLQIMDYAFSDCTSLKEADVIPVSVSSMQYTFENCVSLQDAASFDKTSCLTNITGVYSGCSSLRAAVAVPETVTAMDKAYMDCVNIKESVKFPSNVQSISEAYSGCSGLQSAATIPESVTNMGRCYSGCSSLCGSLEINSDTDEFGGLLQGATSNGDRLELSGNSGNLLAIQKDSSNSNIALADPAAAALQNERMIREREFQKGGNI